MAKQDIHTIDELHTILKKHKPYLLDVRTIEEYCNGHICSATNIQTPKPPLKDVDRMNLENKLLNIGINNKNALIIVYCKLGIRANIAKNILKEIGFTNVMSLGGIDTQPLKSIITGTVKSPYLKVCYCSNQK